MSVADIFLALVAVLFPPIAVWIKRGICSVDSLLNILLCCLGYLPGLLHAWYIIARFPDESSSPYAPLAQDAAPGDGRVTYYYVSADGARAAEEGRGAGPPGHGQRGYGTTGAQQPKSGGSSVVPAPAPARVQGGGEGSGEGSGEGARAAVPPSYEEVVKGDHKVQT